VKYADTQSDTRTRADQNNTLLCRCAGGHTAATVMKENKYDEL